MSRSPDPARLARLLALATLKRDAELARLARIGRTKARLQDALDTLRRAEAPLTAAEAVADPAMVAARLAHARWGEGQQRRVNQQLAMVTADWHRQTPAAARAFGRAAVLQALTDQNVVRRCGKLR